MRLIRSYGTRQLFSGLRRGNRGAAGLGAALVLVDLLQSRRRPRKELLFARNLRTGETWCVRLHSGEEVVEETRVEG